MTQDFFSLIGNYGAGCVGTDFSRLTKFIK